MDNEQQSNEPDNVVQIRESDPVAPPESELDDPRPPPYATPGRPTRDELRQRAEWDRKHGYVLNGRALKRPQRKTEEQGR